MTPEPPPTPDDLRRLQELFEAALELPAEARAAFARERAGDDPALLRRLEAMLEDDRAGGTLAPPVVPGSLAERLEPGSRIGARYTLVERLGEGGFGVVWLAEQHEPVRRRVALKVIKLGMDTEEVVLRFEAERQALALMSHPGIARVLDAGVTDGGRPYFVMEPVEGEPVTAFCDRRRLGTRARLELFADICDAVQHAHQKGVLHRDLKPGNVLVGLEDGRPRAHVIDFGIAKALHTRLTERTLRTELQRFLGTPAYMSPEQAAPEGDDVDTRTDIWSLGVLLYELLTGGTPHDGADLLRAGVGEVRRRLREDPTPRPSTRVSTRADARAAEARGTDPRGLSRRLRGDLDWIVLRCLEPDRERRYPSAAALADDLRRHLAGEPVEAGPPGGAYRLGKFLRRNRVGVSMAGALLAAVLVAVVGLAIGNARARDQRDHARQEAAHTRDLLAWLLDSLSLSDPDVALRPDVTMLELLRHAEPGVAAAFAGRPAEEAQVRSLLGRAFASLESHLEAERNLTRADALLADLPDADLLERYRVLWPLTHVSFKLQRPGAMAIANRAREVGLAHVGTRHPELAEELRALTYAVYAAAYDPAPGALDPALGMFEAARARSRAELVPGDPRAVVVADTYLALGFATWHAPHEARSAVFWEEGLAIQGRELPAGHPDRAEALGQLVGLLNRAGRPEEAEAHVRGALADLRAVYPEGHFRIAFLRGALGESLTGQGRYAEAEVELLASRAVIEAEDLGEGNFYRADALVRLVQLYDAWGRRTAADAVRDELARALARSPLSSGWVLARVAVGPPDDPRVEATVELDALAPRSYGAAPGGSSDAAIEAVLGRLAEGLRTLDPASDRARLLAREALAHAAHFHLPTPGEDAAGRVALVDAAVAVLDPLADELPLYAAEARALRSELRRATDDRDGAAADVARTAELVRDLPEPGHWTRASTEVRVARALLAGDRPDVAHPLLERARATLLAQVGADHADARLAAELIGAEGARAR